MDARTQDLKSAPPVRIGDFEIVREIGRGSMGIVYEAIQTSLGRRVALKTFQTHAKSPQGLERFKREAGAAAKLVHPGIVPVWGVGQDEFFHYYAMQLVEGKTLREVVYSDKIPLERAVRIAKKIAEALDYAHSHGVIHRDIKPANIIVTADDQPVITDFGLAKDLQMAAMTVAGIVLGTPTHMSPEQAEGSGKVDHRTDIYALGACLYEMITYRLPFYGENLDELLEKVANDEPVRPRALDRAIPRNLEAIVLKALAKRPEDRYQTAGEMAEDLGRFLEGKRVLAPRHSIFTALAHWAAKNRAAAVLVACAFALVMGGATFVLVRAAATRTERGRLLRALDKVDAGREPARALDIVNRILAIDPANQAAHARRAELVAARDRADAEARRIRNREEAATHVRRGVAAAERAETLSGREAEQALDEALDAFGMALGLDPENVAARAGRGRIYLKRALDAERQGDAELAAIYFGLVKEHNPDGLYDGHLKAEGALTVRTTVPGARIAIDRVEPVPELGETRRVREVEPVEAPCTREAMSAGSYVVEATAEGFAGATVPIAIQRGVRDDIEIRLLRPRDIPPGFVYIPAGPFILGGDRKAIRALPRERRRLESYFIAERETTCAEYAAFLASLAPHDARTLLPRGGPRQGYAALFWPQEDGGYAFPKTWSPERPVTGVTFEAAVRYAAWRAAKDKLPLRLPTEFEWEKAARGADGRGYPWGEADPAERANVATDAASGQARPAGTTEGDVSIYGVRDLIGNASEWTSSMLDTRLIHRIVRGGSYMPQVDPPRAAARFPTDVMNPPEHTGIRLACDLPPE